MQPKPKTAAPSLRLGLVSFGSVAGGSIFATWRGGAPGPAAALLQEAAGIPVTGEEFEITRTDFYLFRVHPQTWRLSPWTMSVEIHDFALAHGPAAAALVKSMIREAYDCVPAARWLDRAERVASPGLTGACAAHDFAIWEEREIVRPIERALFAILSSERRMIVTGPGGKRGYVAFGGGRFTTEAAAE